MEIIFILLKGCYIDRGDKSVHFDGKNWRLEHHALGGTALLEVYNNDEEGLIKALTDLDKLNPEMMV
jgi:hypothetical protein